MVESKKILIAEDEAINRMFLVKIITKLGYQCLEARTGKEAIKLYQEHSGDIGLILMDLSMPEMDGIEATKKIRSQNPDIPIVALTAHSSMEDRNLCLTNNMNDIIIKPIQLPQLQQTLKDYMDSTLSTTS